MIVVNSNNTTHTIKIIARFLPSFIITLELYNKINREAVIPENTYVTTDGITAITFDYNFTENQKMQITIKENNIVLFRGNVIAINQDTQEYDPTQGIYTYSTI